MRNWEPFAGHGRQADTVPRVTLERKGRLAFNVAARSFLAEVEYVTLLWEASSRCIGLRPTEAAGRPNYRVALTSRNGGPAVSCKSFMDAHRIAPLTRYSVSVEEDVIVLTPLSAPTSPAVSDRANRIAAPVAPPQPAGEGPKPPVDGRDPNRVVCFEGQEYVRGSVPAVQKANAYAVACFLNGQQVDRKVIAALTDWDAARCNQLVIRAQDSTAGVARKTASGPKPVADGVSALIAAVDAVDPEEEDDAEEPAASGPVPAWATESLIQQGKYHPDYPALSKPHKMALASMRRRRGLQ